MTKILKYLCQTDMIKRDRKNWKVHVQSKPNNRIAKAGLHYILRGRRNTDLSTKRWHE